MPRRTATPNVVGRDAELTVFASAFEAAASGSPSVVLVSGDAGIGKSTLVAEAARRGGAATYLGRGVQVGGAPIALAPLVDLVRQVQRRPPDDPPPSLQELADALQHGGDQHRTADVFALTLQLVGELGRSGRVLVGIEDLHWGDPTTCDLFEYLVRNLTDEPVVVTATFRHVKLAADPVLRRRLAEIVRLPIVHRLELGGLDRGAIAAQTAAELGIPPPPSLVDELMRRGEGNPFFTEELVAAHLAGEPIPALLSELLAADVAALDQSARQVVRAIAAVGRDTDSALLEAIVDLDQRAVEDALRQAVEARLIDVDPASDAYRFRHSLVGEVVYAELLPTERRRLHRSIADAFRNHPGLALTSGDAAGELAFHLDRAGDEQAAFAALLDAADAAETIAPATCLAHLQRAFELWDAHAAAELEEQRRARLWQAADLASAVGDNERAIALANDALGRGAPPRGTAWGYERLGRFFWSAGRLQESAAMYQQAADLLESEPAAAAAAAQAGLAQADLMFCRFGAAEQWTRRALEGAPTSDVATRAMALRVLAVLDVQYGRLDDAIRHGRTSIELAGEPHWRALSTAYLALGLSDVGRTAESITLALDAAAESQRAGFETSFAAYLWGVAAHGYIRLGEWAEADTVLAPAAGIDAIPIAAIQLDAAAATLAARRGDLDTARRAATRLAAHPCDPWHQGVVDAATAEVHLAVHEWDAAASIAERRLDPPNGTDVRWPGLFVSHLANARVERTLDALARRDDVAPGSVADDLRRRIADARTRTGATGPVAELHFAVAEASVTRLGPMDPDVFRAVAELADASGDVWTAATMRLYEADAAAAGGAAAAAAEALRRAHEAAARLGARPLLENLEALSRRTRMSIEVIEAAPLDTRDVARMGLTQREGEVLALLAAGRTNRQIGTELFVSEKTASVHVSNILRKLGVTTRVEAAAIAQRLGVA